ncbi:Protein of unknown function [Actinokineospora alba]|uniref:DUF3995 domain-containing protein n=1 Tax=Actinokineospora alba TaxID=504798 RepID=A0A1H0GJU7_9PSEU|nr:DUF3995 domain-containing protein [Actinokineospora alba]TDP69924.1 uncharacterized protein DUF3995 [Actinokineospora alba]SDI05800.1 Protein of unknown function [Actinokineospora alba]SDO07100.1 Protein of unknown function [Actinokineospora alba]
MMVLGGIAAIVLVLVGGLHVVWMFSPWPVRTRAEFARKVVGVEADDLPNRFLTALVAIALFAAAYLVAARAGIVGVIGPRWATPVGTATVAAVLLFRGVAGFITSARKDTEFTYWDLRVYAPLCVVLGGACLAVAVGTTG